MEFCENPHRRCAQVLVFDATFHLDHIHRIHKQKKVFLDMKENKTESLTMTMQYVGILPEFYYTFLNDI